MRNLFVMIFGLDDDFIDVIRSIRAMDAAIKKSPIALVDELAFPPLKEIRLSLPDISVLDLGFYSPPVGDIRRRGSLERSCHRNKPPCVFEPLLDYERLHERPP